MSETAGFKVQSLLATTGGNLRLTYPQFNHTMLRVKDPKVSLKFYTEVRTSSYLTLPD